MMRSLESRESTALGVIILQQIEITVLVGSRGVRLSVSLITNDAISLRRAMTDNFDCFR